MKLVVRKHDRQLELHRDGQPVKVCRIVLGFSPVGDKEREGDGRTPEGEFIVCAKNPKSRFTLSIGLDYPAREDAERGLRDGIITQDERDAIVAAHDAGKRPPWNTALGGEIFIHGGGTASDWTQGCIALEDEDIREIYDAVEMGTPVVIEP